MGPWVCLSIHEHISTTSVCYLKIRMIWLWNPTLLKKYLLWRYLQRTWKPYIPHCTYVQYLCKKIQHTERGPHPTATTSPLAPSQVNDNNNHRCWPTAARCLPEHQVNEWVGLTCLILTSVGNLLSCELLRQAGHLRFEMWLKSRNQGQVAIVLKCYANIPWPNYAYAWHGFQLHQTMPLQTYIYIYTIAQTTNMYIYFSNISRFITWAAHTTTSGWSHRASPCHGLYQFTAEGIGTQSRDSVQPHKTQILWPNSLKSEMNLRFMKEHMVRGTLTYDLFFSHNRLYSPQSTGVLQGMQWVEFQLRETPFPPSIHPFIIS